MKKCVLNVILKIKEKGFSPRGLSQQNVFATFVYPSKERTNCSTNCSTNVSNLYCTFVCFFFFLMGKHVLKNSSVTEHEKKVSETDMFVWAKTYLQSKQNFYMFVQNRGKLLGPQDGSISIYIMRSKQLRSCIFKSAYPYDICDTYVLQWWVGLVVY